MAMEVPSNGSQQVVQKIVLEQPSAFGRYGKLLIIALVIAVISCFSLYAKYQSYFSPPEGPQEKFFASNKMAEKKIAVLHVDGAIIESNGFVKQQIDRITEDDSIVAVVLRIDSPGGTVAASDYLYHHLVGLRDGTRRDLPVVVSMGGLCASGGYYLAMAVGDEKDCIFAEPSTWTGSIGVVIPHYNFAGLLERFDVTDDSIASQENKLMGSPTRQLSEEDRKKERALLQSLVDESYARFKDIVKSGRPKLAKDADKFAEATTGQVFSSDKALELGLVDKIGYIEDALVRAAELANQDISDVRCVEYERPPTLLTAFMGADAKDLGRGQSSFGLSEMIDLATPRAYYLWSAVPGAMAR